MAYSKFTKTTSFFETTLSQRLTDSTTEVSFDAVPGGEIQYPTWAVIRPKTSSVELVYLPSAPSGTTYSSVVRGLDPEGAGDTDEGFSFEHPQGSTVIIGITHRHWNELVNVLDGVNGTGAETLRIGKDADDDITIYAQNADASKPFVRYDATTSKWLISNDGTSTFDIAAGGSGLTRGPGVDVVASAITLDVRSSGGLRNNQGTGSVQADVDPAIVARLDTANTWGAVQTFTADQVQLSTDPDSDNDAVRNSYMKLKISSGAVSGTSGEAITAGHGVYVKVSDGKLYKTDGTTDESTFKFVGIALETVGAADTAVTYAPPGHTVTGLSGLTAGSYYFITDTAGTLGTTPGTRFARVALAVSTTALQVVTPKYVVSGNFSFTATGDNAVTTGFYPARVTIRAVTDDTGGGTGGFAASKGMCVGGDDNLSVGYGHNGTTFGSNWDTANTIRLYNNTTSTTLASINSKSATGFNLNVSAVNGVAGRVRVFWTAFSE